MGDNNVPVLNKRLSIGPIILIIKMVPKGILM